MNPSSRFWTASLGRLFALDLRSLALLRFALGGLLLVDSLARFADVGALLSDAGVLPRAVQTLSPWRWSLYLANGQTGFSTLLLTAQVIAAVGVMLGWHSRRSILIAWLLWVSLCNRNPLIVGSGDVLLGALLFWSLFLPMAARWSVDAALSPVSAEPRHASWASVALLLQILSVWIFQALLEAPLSAALSIRHGWLAEPLQQQPLLVAALSVWALWLQLIAPPLLLLASGRSQGWRRPLRLLRGLLLLQLIALALIQAAMLDRGLLPWLQIAALAALLGADVWTAQRQRLQARQPGDELRLYYDRDCAFCLKVCRLLTTLLILPQARILPAQEHRRADALLRASHSWVVIDHDDNAYLKGAALLLLLRRSPLLGALAGLTRLAAVQALADRLYEAVAQRRTPLAALASRWLPERERLDLPSTGLQRLAGVLATLVLVWNLAGLQRGTSPLQALIAPALETLRLDQRWDGESPAPVAADHAWIAAGHLADGREVDALRAGHAPVIDTGSASDDDRYRWRLWQRQMAQPAAAAFRLGWGEYLCRHWNRGLASDSADRLIDFRLIDVVDLQPGDGKRLEQHVLARQDCTALR